MGGLFEQPSKTEPKTTKKKHCPVDAVFDC